MIKPSIVSPDDEVTTVGRVFSTPVVVKGKSWFPLIELALWGFMAWVAGRRRPERSLAARLGVGALTMPIVVASEWCHNFAHAAAAYLVGKPMDVLRITWGTPLVVYYDLEDKSVTPRQHIIRALGGPVFNALVVPVALLLRRFTAENSVLRDAVDAAIGMNAFIVTVGLLPLPGIDGGSLLKWGLVERGHTPAEADLVVRKVDGVVGAAAGVGAWLALRKRRWLLSATLSLITTLGLGYALGVLKEN